MKKKPVRSPKTAHKSHNSLRRGKLGAGTAYVLMGLGIIGFGAVSMLGNIVPIGRDGNSGVPVEIQEFKSGGTHDNLQLETFKGEIIKPTATTAPPFEDPTSGRSSGSDSHGDGDDSKGDDDDDGGGDGDGDSSCFPAGTKIAMADGSRKNIEDVKVGDKIKGFDGKKQVTETVLEIESPIRDHLYELKFSDGTSLKLTREHPLFTQDGWKSISPADTAKENPRLAVEVLRVGDDVLDSNGKYVGITAINYLPGKVQTYNLKSVSGFNNYFAGEKLAHNKGSCFVKGTKILMADGSQKNIEDVKVGDKVTAYDGKKQVIETVLETESPIRDHYYNVTLADGTKIGVTSEHPLLTVEGWKSISPKSTKRENAQLVVGTLNVGDKVINNKGQHVAISGIDYKHGTVQTYNLSKVSGQNTFFANGVVAHNKGDGGGDGDGGGGGDSGGGSSGGGGNSGGGGGCFVQGTTVLMADGSRKNIENVKPGDKIISYDGKGQSIETVTAVQAPVVNHHYKVLLSDGTTLGVTDNHALYTNNGWEAINPAAAKEENPKLSVGKLSIGDQLLNKDGKYVTIVNWTYVAGDVQTYNLKGITNHHNYYADGIVAHNKQ